MNGAYSSLKTMFMATAATFVMGQSAQAATLTFTSFFSVAAAEEFTNPEVLVGSSTFNIQSFNPAWGTLNSVSREVTSQYQYSLTSTGAFRGGDFLATGGAAQVFFPGEHPDDALSAFTQNQQNSTYYREENPQAFIAGPEGTVHSYSGTLEPGFRVEGPQTGTIADQYVSATGGPIEVETWLQLGSGNARSTIPNGGSGSGLYSVTYDFASSSDYDPETVLLDTDENTLFDRTALEVPDDVPVGAIEEIFGTATIYRNDGSEEAVTLGSPLYSGDRIETDASSGVNIVFIDESTIAISDNARLDIDDMEFDPNAESEETNLSILRSIFVYTSGLIGRDDPDDVLIDAPIGSLGFRGDAAEIIEQLDPEAFEAIDPAARGTFASPVSLTAVVDVPTDPFEMSFDYSFLDGGGTLDVFLGGQSLYSNIIDSLNAGDVFNVNLSISETLFSTLGNDHLEFLFEGPTGESFVLDNVVFPGFMNGDFSLNDFGWFASGPGGVELVGILDSSYLSENVSPVPVPASLPLLAVGLGALGLMRRRKRKAV